MGIFEKFKPKQVQEQENPKHWREIAEEEKEEEEEEKKLRRVLKELPEEKDEEEQKEETIEEEKTLGRILKETPKEREEEEREIMRVVKETPEEKLERLEGNLAQKEKEYKSLKSIRTFFGLSKNKEEKAEIEKEYEEARAKAEEAKNTRLDKEKIYLKEAGIKKRDINYILGQ